MASFMRQNISLKVSNILSRIANGKNENLAKKVEYFTKIGKVDRSSKEFGVFSIDLNKLSNEIDLKQNEKLEFKEIHDDLVESCRLEKNNKLLIKTNLNILKKKTIENIFCQKFNYGFKIDQNEIYPKIAKNNQLDWFPKLSVSNTLIEFSSPNIAKPLHAGHMRSTFLGNFLSNLHEKLGHNVTRINYLGDWGTQYGILAVGFKKYGSYEKLKESPIKHLLEVYVNANKDESIKSEALFYFSQMEEKNDESLKMWNLFKDLSIKELESVYQNLNIKFDVYESESQYYEMARELVKNMINKSLAVKLEDNAIQAQIKPQNTKKKDLLKYIVQKSDGTTLYITRDLAALFERKKKYNFSKIVYVVDSSQKDHFYRLYESIKALDDKLLENISFEEFYVPFGRITNMSTRKGKVEFLSDLINEAKQVAYESMEFSKTKKILDDADYVAQNIGNSHLIITDLSKPRLKDYEFSWANIVSKDDSAYMCHYAHARLHSLLEKCKKELDIEPQIENVNFSLLNKSIELILIQHLARFEEIVWQSYEEYEPYHIVQYLFQLVRLTNICLKDNYVLGEEKETAKARLLLYNCSKQVIMNSFQVLGIKALNSI